MPIAELDSGQKGSAGLSRSRHSGYMREEKAERRMSAVLKEDKISSIPSIKKQKDEGRKECTLIG